MPAILDSLFHKVVNTTSIPIGVEGGGWWGATKWRDPPIQKLFYGQSCSDSLLAVCLVGQVGVIYRPPEHPCMPDRPVNEASVKADH